MTRREDELYLIPGNAVGTATPEGIPVCYRRTTKTKQQTKQQKTKKKQKKQKKQKKRKTETSRFLEEWKIGAP